MMDLEEALRHAVDGRAILFLGAGFSVGAKDQQGRDVPVGSSLRDGLMKELGETEDVNLATAADLFVHHKGVNGIISFLNDLFVVSAVNDHHRTFASVSWQSVYTTNYDDCFERACSDINRPFRTVDISGAPQARKIGETEIVHINGFIKNVTVRNYRDSIILSETSYITSKFLASRWSRRFNEDVQSCRAIIFVGYSLYDIDIARILFSEEIKRKCVFVTKPEPSLALRTTLAKFGRIEDCGAEVAGQIIERVRATHVPADDGIVFGSFARYVRAKSSDRSTSIDDIFSLLMSGEVRQNQLSREIAARSDEYIIVRREVAELERALERGDRLFVILSRLANGKSIFIQQAAEVLTDRYDIFVFRKESKSIDVEIAYLRAVSRPTVVIIDDYAAEISVIERLLVDRNENLCLIVSARTPTHLTARERLHAASPDAVFREFRIDQLGEREIVLLEALLSRAGLLGSLAQFQQERRIRYIREDCEAEFRNVLLGIIDSPEIQRRLEAIFDPKNLGETVCRFVVSVLALQSISVRIDIYDVINLVGAENLNQAALSESSAVSDIISMSKWDTYSRSSVYSAAALRVFWRTGIVLEVLEDLLRRAWQDRHDDRRYNSICVGLMRYSNIKEWVPRDFVRSFVGQYYDRIRNLPACTNNELFWLQVSIYDIDRGDFVKAEAHLTQAYSLASKKRGFDTYQLDNTKASLLLSKEMAIGPTSNAFSNFVEAHRIVVRQIRDRKHGYYPYRVAKLYRGFWLRVASGWEPSQQKIFLDSCRAILDYAKHGDADLRAMPDVVRCEGDLQEVLSLAAASR